MDFPDFPRVSLPQLESALEASWSPCTAYLGAFARGNPALGQCYPTASVVQCFFPRFDIAAGDVDTGSAIEAHFSNIDQVSIPAEHVDLTWQQFPRGSQAREPPEERITVRVGAEVNHFASARRACG